MYELTLVIIAFHMAYMSIDMSIDRHPVKSNHPQTECCYTISAFFVQSLYMHYIARHMLLQRRQHTIWTVISTVNSWHQHIIDFTQSMC
jgi:hypothetical protein